MCRKSAVLWVTRVRLWTRATVAINQVGGGHREAWLEQPAADLAELQRAGVVETQDAHVGQEVGDLLEERGRVRDVVGACVQFSQDDGGDEQAAAVLDEPVSQPGRPAEVGRADVGVQQVAQGVSVWGRRSGRRSCWILSRMASISG